MNGTCPTCGDVIWKKDGGPVPIDEKYRREGAYGTLAFCSEECKDVHIEAMYGGG